jgi:hypothetical protein
MITPLDPAEIEVEKRREDTAAQSRRNALAEEEGTLINRVNDLRDIEKREKARISAEITQAQAEADLKIGSLKTEVSGLEARRAQALKPVQELVNQAQEKLDKVLVREAACDEREKNLVERERSVVERAEQQIDLQEDLVERKEDLDSREKGIASEEARLKTSEEALAAKWTDFHETAYAKKTEIESRESAVLTAEKSNDVVRQSLDTQREDQDRRERELRDRYRTLEQAVEEFNKKKNNG